MNQYDQEADRVANANAELERERAEETYDNKQIKIFADKMAVVMQWRKVGKRVGGGSIDEMEKRLEDEIMSSSVYAYMGAIKNKAKDIYNRELRASERLNDELERCMPKFRKIFSESDDKSESFFRKVYKKHCQAGSDLLGIACRRAWEEVNK